jgi:hypothetical protein
LLWNQTQKSEDGREDHVNTTPHALAKRALLLNFVGLFGKQ